jgi:hypothetical protein
MESTKPAKGIANAQVRAGPFIFVSFSFGLRLFLRSSKFLSH